MREEQIYNFLLEGKLNRAEYFGYSAIWTAIFLSGLPLVILPLPVFEILLIAGTIILTLKRGHDIGWRNRTIIFLIMLGYIIPFIWPNFLLFPVTWLFFLFIPGKTSVKPQINNDANCVTITCGRCFKNLRFSKGKGVITARCPNCLNQFRITT